MDDTMDTKEVSCSSEEIEGSEAKSNSLSEYRSFVKRVADASDSSQIIENRNADHAAVIIEAIFCKAENVIRILTGDMWLPIYATKEVVASAESFLNRNPDAKFEILAEEEIDLKNHAFFAALRDKFKSRVHLWSVPREMKDSYPFHFIVADGRHFRFERNKKEFKAIVQFGELDFGHDLENVFERLQKRCELNQSW